MERNDGTTNADDQAFEELLGANPATGPLDDAGSARGQRVYRAAIGDRSTVGARRMRVAAFAGGLAVLAAVAVGGTALLSGGGDSTDPGDGGAAVSNPDEPPVDDNGGEPPLAASCIGYTVEELRLRQFAFAGSVTAIDEREGEFGPTQAVTFAVDEVFSGSPSETITLELDATLTNSMYTEFSFDVGESYLVSGDDAFAWGCGFSRPYDETLADEWRAALSG